MKQKIAGWALILSGASTLLIAGYMYFYGMLSVEESLFILAISILPFAAGLSTLKNKLWALWVGLVYFIIQTIRVESFEWNWSFESPISFYISMSSEGVTVGVNFFALAMLIILIQLVQTKYEIKNL